MRLLPPRYDAQRRRAGVSTRAVALAILGAWLVPALLAAFETVVFWRMGGRSDPAWLAIALQTPAWLAYALLTPLILHFAELGWLQRRNRLVRFGAHALVALACGVVYATVASLTWLRLSPLPTGRSFGITVLGWYLSGLPMIALSYAAVVGGARALYWFARSRDAEVNAARLGEQLAGARLDALRMQLHPHFLFNTLNAITVLVRDGDVAGAERALELLSGLLRDSLRADQRQTVPLAQEIDFIDRYLAIEQVRFSDRLRIRRSVPVELAHAPVPLMILQPLIENAVRHGIREHADAGLIEISAQARDGFIELSVADDGAGPGIAAAGNGVGLANTRERLRVLYGDAATLTLEARPRGGTRVVVRFPLPAHATETVPAHV